MTSETQRGFLYNLPRSFLRYDMLLTHHATVNKDIHSVDITSTAIALHQSGSDGDFAGQSVKPDSDWNVPFVGKHPPKNVCGLSLSYLLRIHGLNTDRRRGKQLFG